MGAYGLAVAAAFAVALAVLLSVSPTVHAQAGPDHTLAADANNVDDVAPGETVRIVVESAFAQVSITGTADGVGGSFDANEGQSISCGNGATCDKDDAETSVSVDLTVDADSGEGHILLSVGGLGATSSTKVINVNKSTLVGSLTIKASPKTISADDGTSTLTINVKNAAGTPVGLNDQAVTVVTTLGSIECDAGTETQACTETTAHNTATPPVPGFGTVTLIGKGVEGEAVITARLGTLTATATVTLFGSAKNLTAVPDQGSVEIGGSVYVVLTVTDGADNPVAGQMITPLTSKEEVVGPEDGVAVVTETNTAAATANADSLLGRGYSKDKPAVGKAAAIPACGDDNTHIGEASATFEELFGPDSEGAANDDDANAGEGTNDKGQCVVYVTAPEDTTDATKNATRGVHTLNFAIGSLKASAEIEVAGKPHRITTDADALDMVEPGGVSTITVSVFDDEDVLVGITSVKVRKVDGGGLIEDEGEDGSEMTTDGQSQFTFIAPSSPGSSEILITAGDVNHRVRLQIGEAMPETPEEPDPPAMPDGDATLSVQGPLGSFSGGSIAEFAAAVEAACPGGATIYVAVSLDDWGTPYVSDATIPLVNATFAARFPSGLAAGTLVAVTRCEADAMEDEG